MSDFNEFIDKKVNPLLNETHRLQMRYYYDLELNLASLKKDKINASDMYEYFVCKGRILKEPKSDRNNNIRTDLWDHARKIAIQETSLKKVFTEYHKKYPKNNLKEIKWIKVKGLHFDVSTINKKKVYSCTIESIEFVNRSAVIRHPFDTDSSTHDKRREVKKRKDKLSKEKSSVEELMKRKVKDNEKGSIGLDDFPDDEEY